MLQKAQSPDYIARVRVWEGKDDRANFAAHVTPLVRQLVELEINGYDVADLLMPLPPTITLSSLFGLSDSSISTLEKIVSKFIAEQNEDNPDQPIMYTLVEHVREWLGENNVKGDDGR